MSKFAIGILLLLGATACSQEVPLAPAPAPTPPSATAVPVESPSCQASANGTQAADDHVFSITLTGQPHCSAATAAAATALAKWDVSSLHATDVAIYVSGPSGEKKLWLEGSATGEATTGPWVFANTCFALQDKISGRTVATRLIGTIPCAR